MYGVVTHEKSCFTKHHNENSLVCDCSTSSLAGLKTLFTVRQAFSKLLKNLSIPSQHLLWTSLNLEVQGIKYLFGIFLQPILHDKRPRTWLNFQGLKNLKISGEQVSNFPLAWILLQPKYIGNFVSCEKNMMTVFKDNRKI